MCDDYQKHADTIRKFFQRHKLDYIFLDTRYVTKGGHLKKNVTVKIRYRRQNNNSNP